MNLYYRQACAYKALCIAFLLLLAYWNASGQIVELNHVDPSRNVYHVPYSNSLFIDPKLPGYLGPPIISWTARERARQVIVP